jgi:hypothetical protein
MTDKPRDRPVRIPMSFDDALRGLRAIDPKKLPAAVRPGAKKKATKKVAKKKGKSNRNNQAGS